MHREAEDSGFPPKDRNANTAELDARSVKGPPGWSGAQGPPESPPTRHSPRGAASLTSVRETRQHDAAAAAGGHEKPGLHHGQHGQALGGGDHVGCGGQRRRWARAGRWGGGRGGGSGWGTGRRAGPLTLPLPAS